MIRSVVRAGMLASLLASPFVASTAAMARPVVEVAFVLDTTGSMGPLIEGAKRKIWSIATSILDANPDAEIRMGLIAYRDIGDVYVTKKFELTTDIQDLYANLLELRARGGGDWPESVNEALHTAVTRLAWSYGPEVCRIMFLVGDAPPHMDYAQDMKYPDVMRLAQARAITVNAVQAGGARDTERVWREIAQMGGGRYIPIPQDGGHVVIIETPYDHDIIELQGRINGTVIPYGPRSQRSSVEDKTRQITAAPRPAATDLASYMNRRAKAADRLGEGRTEAITGRGDLTADYAAAGENIVPPDAQELPEFFRNMKPAERKDYIDKQMADRKTLNEALSELVKKRDQYMFEQRSKAPTRTADSFDRAVEETLKAQIRR
jgi:hypothetical protein